MNVLQGKTKSKHIFIYLLSSLDYQAGMQCSTSSFAAGLSEADWSYLERKSGWKHFVPSGGSVVSVVKWQSYHKNCFGRNAVSLGAGMLCVKVHFVVAHDHCHKTPTHRTVAHTAALWTTVWIPLHGFQRLCYSECCCETERSHDNCGWATKIQQIHGWFCYQWYFGACVVDSAHSATLPVPYATKLLHLGPVSHGGLSCTHAINFYHA